MKQKSSPSLLGKVVKFTFVSPRGRRRASERLWVLCVLDPDDDFILGRLANEPGEDLGVHFGDLLFLSLDHAQDVEAAPAEITRAFRGLPTDIREASSAGRTIFVDKPPRSASRSRARYRANGDVIPIGKTRPPRAVQQKIDRDYYCGSVFSGWAYLEGGCNIGSPDPYPCDNVYISCATGETANVRSTQDTRYGNLLPDWAPSLEALFSIRGTFRG